MVSSSQSNSKLLLWPTKPQTLAPLLPLWFHLLLLSSLLTLLQPHSLVTNPWTCQACSYFKMFAFDPSSFGMLISQIPNHIQMSLLICHLLHKSFPTISIKNSSTQLPSPFLGFPSPPSLLHFSLSNYLLIYIITSFFYYLYPPVRI